MGRAVTFLPYVGMVTIVMNDYPALKVGLILLLGLLVVTSKDLCVVVGDDDRGDARRIRPCS